MKTKFYSFFLFFFLLNSFSTSAQLSCNYRLEMYDSFGDGWNGAFIEFLVDGEVTVFTVANNDNNGDFNIVDIPVVEGTEFTLSYFGGSFENENTYLLFDSEDLLLFQDGPFPTQASVFTDIADCAACPTIDINTVSYMPTSVGSVNMTWAESPIPNSSYFVEIGEWGFEQGTGTSISFPTNSVSISGLMENTAYAAYIQADCGAEGTSNPIGPIYFEVGSETMPLECTYVLELIAGSGNGWENASIDVILNGETVTHTVSFTDNAGDFKIIEIPVVSPDYLVLDYTDDGFTDNDRYRLFDSEGVLVFNSGLNPPSGIGFNNQIICSACPRLVEESVMVTSISGGFEVTWEEGQNGENYIVSYGPLGVTPANGTSVSVSTNAFTLAGQEEGAFFDFYLYMDCGDDGLSLPIGPFFAQAGYTNPPSECFYTLELFSSFNGWNGAVVELEINGFTTAYTLESSEGTGKEVNIAVADGALIVINFISGNFDNTIGYNLFNSEGSLLFTDSSFPAVGDAVFQTTASCPDCPSPLLSSITLEEVGSTFAQWSWLPVPSADFYIIEYGEGCFEQGLGTEITITEDTLLLTDLTPSTLYSYYIQSDCGEEGMSSTLGPFLFETNPNCSPPFNPVVLATSSTTITLTWVPNPITEEYIIQYGPAGFAFGGGLNSEPFSGSFNILGGLQPDTDYDFYVYGNCSETGTNYIGPFSFSTLSQCGGVSGFVFNEITNESATASWIGVSGATNYIFEFGPIGFEYGTGQIQETSQTSYTLTGLNTGVIYDVYITTECGDGISMPIGPIELETVYIPASMNGTNGAPCTYRIDMFDTFGDGWNGSSLMVVVDGVATGYTVGFADNNGSFNSVEFEVLGGASVQFFYNPGSFENENSYQIFDSEDILIFEDGPFPTVGLVLDIIGVCPLCASISDAEIIVLEATQAILSWAISINAQSYTVEYGSPGFEIGTGTIFSSTTTNAALSDLEINTWYNAYITPDCGIDGFGRAFGPLVFKTAQSNDIGVIGLAAPTDFSCVTGLEDLFVNIQNFGENPQQLILAHYSVQYMNEDWTPTTSGVFGGIIGQNGIATIGFDQQVDLSEPGYYKLKIWTDLIGDENINNDTFYYDLTTSAPLPFYENFESSGIEEGLPSGWTSSSFQTPIFEPSVNEEHGVPSTLIGHHFLGFNENNFSFTTHRIGPVEATSILTFDYRTVSFSTQTGVLPYELDINDEIEVLVSTDCGLSFSSLGFIDNSAVIPSLFLKEVSFDLGAYAGESILLKIEATNNNSGNFFLDIDNFNIEGCPESLFIQANMSSAFDFEINEGTVFANPTFGLPPFSFEWTTGDTTAFISGLSFGMQTVTITDDYGCTESLTINPIPTDTNDLSASIFDKLIIAPNPTNGTSILDVSLLQVSDITVSVYDVIGQLVLEQKQGSQTKTFFTLDLTNQSAGIYFVKVEAANSVRVLKVSKV